jgi:predicted transcriptional regulator
MAEPVKYTCLLSVRCQSEVADRVDRAAAAKMMKPSEYIRRAVIDRLQADGMLRAPEAA